MSVNPVAAAFRDFDDATLQTLGNVGLLRRAAKDVAAGRVSAVDESTVEVAGATVRVGPSGPAGATCDCVAAGICQHVLAASLWLRNLAQAPGEGDDDGGPVATGEGAVVDGPTALDELLGLDPLVLAKNVGIAAVRLSRAFDGTATIHPSDSHIDVILAGESTTIRFVRGAGFDGMISGYPRAERPQRHLTAVRLVVESSGREWRWPGLASPAAPTDPSRLSAGEAQALADARATASALWRTGLAHLGNDASDRLAIDSMTARIEGLHRLARLLASAAGLSDDLAAHHDDVTEPQLAVVLADIVAHATAVEAASGDPVRIDRLRGVARRTFVEVAALDLVPLDVRWFEPPAGGRGVTAVFLDRATGQLVETTSARASGTDPSFRRDGPGLLWGLSIAKVVEGAFTLRSPRLDADGELSAGDLSSIDFASARRLGHDDFAPLAVDDWSQMRGADGRGESTVVVRPSSVGDLDLREVAQELSWPLTDTSGRVLDVQIEADVDHRRRADALLALVETRAVVEYIVGVRRVRSGRMRIDVSSVVVRDGAFLRLVPLDFERPAAETPSSGKPSALRQRLSRLASRLAGGAPAEFRPAGPPQQPPTLGERVLLPIVEVLDELAATGRPTLNERQSALLKRQRSMARNLTLGAVSDAVDFVVDAERLDPLALLRCYYVVGRALGLAAG
ncbi:hypothetical protein [Frondihabitans sp. Leaf304]|uniref:hypothetical protein n=1 Tax=Frondihabitans sp. Leaf304 TaxID=1736329 RepID=UPI0007013099|nr:hypothetical protein [Frondihabitans sp. Leaf304]KQQ27279.1 hypothetical protein ASF54_00130 [Frondihabitans sp. Leaf304]